MKMDPASVPDARETLGPLFAKLTAFAAPFLQEHRLLKVHFAEECGLPDHVLLPHKLRGTEGINEGLRYELEVLSSDAYLELKSMIGIPIQVTVLLEDGREKEISGLISEAHQEGADAGFARYTLVIESGFNLLRKRTNARVFVAMDIRQVTRRILSEHIDRNAVLNASFSFVERFQGTYPVRPFWMQYGESDFDYLRRIWAREGISFFIQPSEESSPAHPQHTLVLFDDALDLEPSEAGAVRFHRADGTEQSDALTQWQGVRTLQSGSLARSSWNLDRASRVMEQEQSRTDQGPMGVSLASTLDHYQHHIPLDGETAEMVAWQTRRRLLALEGKTKAFEGTGHVRNFRPGTWFQLTQHPIHDQDEAQDFVIVKHEFEAENNLPADLTEGLTSLLSAKGKTSQEAKSEVPYRTRITCLRRGVPILPDEIVPPDPGMIPAQVVGPAGSVVHTDELGRIKVRFLFARSGDHPEGGASNTDMDSAWVRQVETWGSQGFGASYLPRVGDEVSMEFLNGDPDKPVITGSLHHRAKTPASFGDASVLPNEHALAGMRSRMHHGSGGNELILDDTTAQLRARFASDHTASHLNLGYLVHPRSASVGTPRGEGFDLRSDAWGCVRSERGLLITTFRTLGPHLDADPLGSQMESALELAQALSDTGEPLGADELEVNKTLKEMKTSVLTQQKQGKTGKAVPAFKDPVLGIASPDGVVSAAPNQILSAGQHIHITAGEDTNLGVGKRLAMAIKESWSVFVSKSGIKLFAAKKDFDIQAHSGNIQILADQNAKTTCTKGELQVLAKQYIRLTAGQCQIEITPTDVNLYMPGEWVVKSNMHFGGTPTGLPLSRLEKAEIDKTRNTAQNKGGIYWFSC